MQWTRPRTNRCRGGVRWTAAEEDRRFEAVRAGTPVETLIADFGRTKGALNSRARKMLPFDHPASQEGDAITELHQLLIDDPDYRPPMTIREELRQAARNRSRPHTAPTAGTWTTTRAAPCPATRTRRIRVRRRPVLSGGGPAGSTPRDRVRAPDRASSPQPQARTTASTTVRSTSDSESTSSSGKIIRVCQSREAPPNSR